MIVAESWADLSDGTLDAPININEFGGHVGIQTVWTSTNTNGSYSSGGDCSTWSVGVGNAGGTGRTDRVNSEWTDVFQLQTCNQTYRLYCFEK